MEFAKIDKNTRIRVLEPGPLFLAGGMSDVGSASRVCTGDDGCPFCEMFGPPIEKKVKATITDKSDGTTKTMLMSEEKYNQFVFKAVPKGRCLHLRVRSIEVRFWFMWWKLPLWDRRTVKKVECKSWMFGPWEIVWYW
jgi:hypothetical protein